MYAYEYDSAGNLIRTRARSSTGPIAAEYTYTNDGLLQTATCGGSTTLTNTWDGMGYRIGLTRHTAQGDDEYSFVYNHVARWPAPILWSNHKVTVPTFLLGPPAGLTAAGAGALCPSALCGLTSL